MYMIFVLFCMTYSLCPLIDTFWFAIQCIGKSQLLMLGHEYDPKHECTMIHSPHAANIQYTLVFIGRRSLAISGAAL